MEDKKTEFKVKIQEFESLFYFDETCPLYIAKEALFQCSKWLGKIEDEAKVISAESPTEILDEEASKSVPAIEPEVFQDIVCDNAPQPEEIPQEVQDDQSA